MSYSLDAINTALAADPAALVAGGSALYESRVQAAAALVLENLPRCPIVLLSGPSGSGKTTTAIKIDHALEARGVITHTISLDNYFRDVDPATSPRTADGSYDFESPACMDQPLLQAHIAALIRGEEIQVPVFDFTKRARAARSTPLRLHENEAVIFEGIHALNPAVTGGHPEAAQLFVCPGSDVVDSAGQPVFPAPWLRLARRMVRDYRYRNTSAAETLAIWENVCRGEQLYIQPYRHLADMELDSALPFEAPLFSGILPPLLPPPEAFPENAAPYRPLAAAYARFSPLDPALVPADSLLREFIGGSSYHYSSGVN